MYVCIPHRTWDTLVDTLYTADFWNELLPGSRLIFDERPIILFVFIFSTGLCRTVFRKTLSLSTPFISNYMRTELDTYADLHSQNNFFMLAPSSFNVNSYKYFPNISPLSLFLNFSPYSSACFQIK